MQVQLKISPQSLKRMLMATLPAGFLCLQLTCGHFTCANRWLARFSSTNGYVALGSKHEANSQVLIPKLSAESTRVAIFSTSIRNNIMRQTHKDLIVG